MAPNDPNIFHPANEAFHAAASALDQLIRQMAHLRDPHHAGEDPETYFHGQGRFAYDAALSALLVPAAPPTVACLISQPVDPRRIFAINLLRSEIRARASGAYTAWAHGEDTRWIAIPGLHPASVREFPFLPETTPFFDGERKIAAAFRPSDAGGGPSRPAQALERHGLRAPTPAEMERLAPSFARAMPGTYVSLHRGPETQPGCLSGIAVDGRSPEYRDIPATSLDGAFLVGIVRGPTH